MPVIDLDVDTPEKVSRALRRAAQAYYEAEGDLQAAWTDRTAGRVWRELGKVLDRAADAAERTVQRWG